MAQVHHISQTTDRLSAARACVPSPLAGVDPARFRNALAQFATGVTVVTTGTEDGRRGGFTANAFTSVSLEPPLVLVCADLRSASAALLREAGRFAIHILADDQEDDARAMARPGADKLDAVSLARSARGCPVLARYLALLECDLAHEYEGGDHTILLGRVVACDVAAAAPGPLTYFRRQLGALGGAVRAHVVAAA